LVIAWAALARSGPLAGFGEADGFILDQVHGLVGAFFQRREAALHFTAEAGMSYYFQAKNLYEPQTQKTAVVLLKPLDSDEGELLMSQFSFSTSNPKK